MSAPANIILIIGTDRFSVVDRFGRERDRLAQELDPATGVDEFDGDDSAVVASAVDAARTPSMFGGGRLVVLRDGLSEATIPVVSAYAAVPSPDSTFLLMHVKSGSGPKGLAELVKIVRSTGMLVEPAPPPQRERELAEWVRGRAADAGVAIRPDAAQLIAAHVGPDAGAISTLLGQLDAAHPGETIDRDQVGAVVSGPATAKAWDLTDAIDAGDKAKALTRLHALLGDMHPLQVQSVLINHVRRLLAATELQPSSAGDVERALNVKGFPAKKLFEKVRSMPAGAAVAAHREVVGADVALRGGSGLDSAVVLEVLTVRLAALLGARGRSSPRV